MRRTKSYDLILGIALFFGFTLSMLITLLIAARTYQGIQTTADSRFSEDTCIRYLTTKIRSYDSSDLGIRIERIGSSDAIVFDDYDMQYSTYIYCHDGKLMELTAADGYEITPGNGSELLELESISFAMSDNLITIHCTGTEQIQAHISLQSEPSAFLSGSPEASK